MMMRVWGERGLREGSAGRVVCGSFGFNATLLLLARRRFFLSFFPWSVCKIICLGRLGAGGREGILQCFFLSRSSALCVLAPRFFFWRGSGARRAHTRSAPQCFLILPRGPTFSPLRPFALVKRQALEKLSLAPLSLSLSLSLLTAAAHKTHYRSHRLLLPLPASLLTSS